MKNRITPAAVVARPEADDPYLMLGPRLSENDRYWRWGDDNLFPYALALMSRRSTTHRRIINDKADYISGKGFSFDATRTKLAALVARAKDVYKRQ